MGVWGGTVPAMHAQVDRKALTGATTMSGSTFLPNDTWQQKQKQQKHPNSNVLELTQKLRHPPGNAIKFSSLSSTQ